MAKYEIQVGGDRYEVEAPDEASLHQAVAKITAHAAASQGVQKATEEAAKRNPDPATMPREQKNEMLAQNMDLIDPRLSSAYRVNDVAAGAALPMAAAGAALPLILQHPAIAGAVIEGGPRLAKGDIPGALEKGLTGAAEGKILGMAGAGRGKLLQFLSRMRGGGAAAAVAELAGLGGEAAPAVAAATKAAPAARAAAAGLSEAQAAKTFAPGAESMKDISEKIISWRKDMGLSAGQIAASLREQYKVPLAIGKKMAQTVIDSLE